MSFAILGKFEIFFDESAFLLIEFVDLAMQLPSIVKKINTSLFPDACRAVGFAEDEPVEGNAKSFGDFDQDSDAGGGFAAFPVADVPRRNAERFGEFALGNAPRFHEQFKPAVNFLRFFFSRIRVSTFLHDSASFVKTN